MQGARRGAGQGDDRSTGGEVTFHFDEGLKVYLHRDAVDFRKSINGLAVLVEQAMGLDPFAAAVYVFRNRRADRIK
ncbi:IS66 family insertion sequence element accessory protein TnpB, partial [Ralstonia pseudosolanacearum]|uniref:IS66 family insertion sequence element accessory protein TnpB n=1 Tax=Ralstonia pseudosolanacearum TaxID=1310165 RepID=UPI003CEBC565